MAGILDIARRAGMKQEEAEKLFGAIIATMKDGERVQIRHFGTFHPRPRKKRMVHSPQIPGGKAQVKAKIVMAFKSAPQVVEDLTKCSKKITAVLKDKAEKAKKADDLRKAAKDKAKAAATAE